MCVCKGCNTHVQVWWDVCRVHGLSLSSSVTIPRLSLPLLLDRIDKVDYLPLFLSRLLSLSFFYFSQGNQCLSLLCLLCKWTAAFSMFFSPLCSLAQLLILLSVSDKQTLENIHRLPLCLPGCLTSARRQLPFSFACTSTPGIKTHWYRRRAWKLQDENELCLSVCTVSPATTPSCC